MESILGATKRRVSRLTASAALSLALYAFVTTITPGPNNLMLATSGLTFGFRRTVPHMAGILSGVAALIVLCGLGLGKVFQAEPQLQVALKIVGSGYLLYLAARLWRAGSLQESGDARPLGFWAAVMFQFVNPKALVMAVTVVSAFVVPGEGYGFRVALAGALFTLVALPCIASWAIFGAGVRSILRSPRAVMIFNHVMAVLTALTAILILM